MYRIGICDDDKVFCNELEAFIREFAHQECLIINIENFYSGESLIYNNYRILPVKINDHTRRLK